ncbi:hypothetical protein B2G51_13030 [Leptospira santarosai]|uniref:Uncharacterized protein n=1 Tax=Leptospira santarosai serovar Shermani str. LT 821 TaxID=758847 RepID=K8Y5L0_9LEPT|nr:hypothetical protein B2G51_13030 [Leptospira santarosai]EKT88689.1 hypothetical protein LSS_00015 [Leptospira santarosai serovar Shermani str. LT 821]ONF88336.1 hypothetical protein BWD13_03850 [Leptospira santarosai serovar Grippotyphosa]
MSFLLLYQKDQAAPGFGIGSYKSGCKRDSYIKSEEEKDSRQRKEFAVRIIANRAGLREFKDSIYKGGVRVIRNRIHRKYNDKKRIYLRNTDKIFSLILVAIPG